MEITKERLEVLEDIELKMNALETGGVDNWEFYGEALDEYNKEKERCKEQEKKFEDICEVLCEGINEPAGSGAGFGFTEEALDNAYRVFIRVAKK